jgi:hypothetical protein
MMVYLGWTFAGLLMLATGWFASAWFHQRKIVLLQVQIKVLRQTATAHADQARRQIGQLQADLANRPPATPSTVASDVQDTPAQQRPRRRAGVAQKFMREDDGFPQTAIVGAEGFAPTELQS